MNFDPTKTALLTLDYQKGIFGMVAGSEKVVPNGLKVIEAARKRQFQVIHVGLGFLEGHPEIPEINSSFKAVKQKNLFVKGTESSQFHPDILRPEDWIVYKQRVSAFSENQLHLILRSRGISQIVFFGVSTSGIVLSTLRRAFDLDYQSTVIQDACFDVDPEVHRVLTEKVFVRQAMVVTAEAFVNGQEKKAA